MKLLTKIASTTLLCFPLCGFASNQFDPCSALPGAHFTGSIIYCVAGKKDECSVDQTVTATATDLNGQVTMDISGRKIGMGYIFQGTCQAGNIIITNKNGGLQGQVYAIANKPFAQLALNGSEYNASWKVSLAR